MNLTYGQEEIGRIVCKADIVNPVNPKLITIPMKDSKKPWYQLKDSETKWYHHLMHGRVLIMLVLMAIVCLLALGMGIYMLFEK